MKPLGVEIDKAPMVYKDIDTLACFDLELVKMRPAEESEKILTATASSTSAPGLNRA